MLQAIKYLDFVVHDSDDPAIWNYLLSIYAHSDGAVRGNPVEDELIQFITSHDADRFVDWRCAMQTYPANISMPICL